MPTLKALLAKAIDAHPDEAAKALELLHLGDPKPLTVDGLSLAAAVLGVERTELWVDRLEETSNLRTFRAAMRGQGVAIGDPTPEFTRDHVDADELRFARIANARRCRVVVNHQVAGSGHLIGPSLVLTAWHVIAVGPPGSPQASAPDVEIELSDGRRLRAIVPPCWQSECGDAEYRHELPKQDADVADRHDVAVLAIERRAGAHLGYAGLPAIAPTPETGSTLYLAHYPGGRDAGFGKGYASKIRGITARWRHSISTTGGSSGGACFDRSFTLAGIHQGMWMDDRRLVPLSGFLENLRSYVAADVTPTRLWSLNGRPDGVLVIGREVFFDGIAAAAASTTRARGVWIKRRAIEKGATGLAFSHDILAQILSRTARGHTIVRIPVDDLIADLGDEIRRRTHAAGLDVAEPLTNAGVATGQASVEAVTKDAADSLARAVNAAANATDGLVWYFFDNPTVVITDRTRLFFEGFVGSALVQPRIRLVIAGFETVLLAGEEFASAAAAQSDGAPGFVVEYLGGFTRDDVLDFLGRAAQELGASESAEEIEARADRVLLGRQNMSGVYPSALLQEVTAALGPDLAVYASRGATR